ncbi:hypothetical protein KGA66_26620 [Actinocrinis puniceicyclus]|uniref:Uncharacterized protein n=1 Tax=Actinocrinis puniceicyclus TaxID=977794 RepID=A0A8J8BHC0_9ACTN|nr:hypothetical protein [Actinocrinis puniceicyclus]MBS2966639.1 hypothetical protein [Actinocrinis puniceicyclus]
MLARLAGASAAAFLLLVVLLAAAGAAIAAIVTAPITLVGQALDAHLDPKQLTAAQYCVLGKITPGRPTGYGTYSREQLANATTIYQVSVTLGLPIYAAQIATATALQESDLYDLDQGDRDSLGLFQQRPSQGWGTPQQIMDPVYASTKFYEALIKVPDWQTMPLWQAAQAVQRSAYPGAYAQWAYIAGYLVATVSGALVGSQCQ